MARRACLCPAPFSCCVDSRERERERKREKERGRQEEREGERDVTAYPCVTRYARVTCYACCAFHARQQGGACTSRCGTCPHGAVRTNGVYSCSAAIQSPTPRPGCRVECQRHQHTPQPTRVIHTLGGAAAGPGARLAHYTTHAAGSLYNTRHYTTHATIQHTPLSIQHTPLSPTHPVPRGLLTVCPCAY